MTHDIKNLGEKNNKSLHICKPGYYRLTENIIFSPCKSKTAAIVIQSNNVILDLNGKVLEADTKYSQVNGIVVKSGYANVTILGNYGVIRNFPQRGIYIQGNNKNIVVGDETLLTVTKCGYGTRIAALDGTETILQGGIQFGDPSFFAWAGIGKFHGILENLKVNNVLVTGNALGVLLGEGTNYNFFNVNISENYENRLFNPAFTAPNFGSFYVENSVVLYGLCYLANPELPPKPGIPTGLGLHDILLENCQFNNNLTDASKNGSAGAYCDALLMAVNFTNLKINNCKFNNNKTDFGSNTNGVFSQTRGCVLGSGYGTVIQNSEFNGNKGGFLVHGLDISGLISANADTPSRDNFPAQSVVIRNCTASDNIADQPASNQVFVSGFQLQYPGGLTLENCYAENNKADLSAFPVDNTFVGVAIGAFIFSDPKFCNKFANNISIKNSKFSRNRVVNGNIGTSAGIRVFDDLCENIVIQNNTITDNKPAFCEPIHNDTTFQTIGIDLFNQVTRKTGPSYVSVLDNVIQSNGTFGIVNNLDITNIQNNKLLNHSVGINLQNCYNCSIIGNTLLTNNTAITDFNTPSTNLIADNRGFNNRQFYCQFIDNLCTPGEVVLASSNLTNMPVLPNIVGYNSNVNVPAAYPQPEYICCDCQTGELKPCETLTRQMYKALEPSILLKIKENRSVNKISFKFY